MLKFFNVIVIESSPPENVCSMEGMLYFNIFIITLSQHKHNKKEKAHLQEKHISRRSTSPGETLDPGEAHLQEKQNSPPETRKKEDHARGKADTIRPPSRAKTSLLGL